MLENKNSIEFIEYLKKKLQTNLLGFEAHKLMAPTIEGKIYRNFEPDKDAYKSAVLILLILDNNKIQILFTLRSKNISHSGQISFPGGRSEINETAELTALRETSEEVGISKDIEIIGRLSQLYVPPSKSLIFPVVGFIKYLPKIIINSDEVQEAFLIPFDYFLTGNYLKKEVWNFNEQDVLVPFWDIHTTPLWGATAMILSELMEISKAYFDSK